MESDFTDTFLNVPELIHLYIVKKFQVRLSNMDISIYYSFICLHTIKWFHALLCNINNVTSVICLHTVKWIFIYDLLLFYLPTVKWFKVLLCIIKNSIKHQSFIYTKLDDQTVLFQTIKFST